MTRVEVRDLGEPEAVVSPGADVPAWEAAGATWVLTSIEPQPSVLEIRGVIEAGPDLVPRGGSHP
jgi:hypothetical protein